MPSIKSCFEVIKRFTLLVLMVAITVFCGCAPDRRNVKRVYKEWTETMSELGIFPVFPPREDVQVGDVWILPMHPFETDLINYIGGLGHTGIWCANIFALKTGTNTVGTQASQCCCTTTVKGQSSTGTSTVNVCGNNQVCEFYKKRLIFPSTTDTPASIIYAMQNGSTTASSEKSDANLVIMKVPEDPKRNIFDYTDADNGSVSTHRLKQVAFPEFTFTRIDKIALNALVPIEYLIDVGGGFAYDKVKQVTLKIPSAESYGCPAANLLEKFFENDSIVKGIGTGTVTRAGTGTDHLYLKEWDWKSRKPEVDVPGVKGLTRNTARLAHAQFRDALEKLAKNGDSELKEIFEEKFKNNKNNKDKDCIWVAVIDEVFYARAMDINISTRKGWGGGLNVQPITNKMLEELDRLKNIKKSKITTKYGTATTNANTHDTGGRNIVETIEEKETGDAFELARKINEFNTNLGKQVVPGGSVNIVSVSKTSIGLRRIFDKPIAVGVRGVIMKIDIAHSDTRGLKIDLGEN